MPCNFLVLVLQNMGNADIRPICLRVLLYHAYLLHAVIHRISTTEIQMCWLPSARACRQLLISRVLQSAIWLHHHPLHGVDSVQRQILLMGTCRQCVGKQWGKHCLVCCWPQSQEGNWARPHLCKLARHRPWPARKRFIRDHIRWGKKTLY